MIVFQNDDLIPIEAFTTMGINAKPNTTSPLGHFGTGLKYAVAVTLRMGGTFKLFRGTEEYEFYLKDTDFRGKSFQLVRMKKRKGWNARWTYHELPFTTEYGKEWLPWMVVRELESNTRDENGYTELFDTPDTERSFFQEGQTTIVVDHPDLDEAYRQLDTIFMPEKELVFESLEVEIYRGASRFIFYRGLRVTDLPKPSVYTYNFKTLLGLTEDRTSKYPSHDSQQIRSAIMGSTDQDFVASIMDLEGDKTYEEMLDFDQVYYSTSPTFTSMLSERVISGGHVPPRMKTYHRNLNPVIDPEETLSIDFTLAQWKTIYQAVTYNNNSTEKDTIADSILVALDENGTPYDHDT